MSVVGECGRARWTVRQGSRSYLLLLIALVSAGLPFFADASASSAAAGSAAQLTSSLFSDSPPVWSPDGTQIAFASGRDGGMGLYVMHADGSSQTKVVDGGAGYQVSDLAWSPGGSKIAFTAGTSSSGGCANLFVVDASAGATPQLLDSGHCSDRSPTWASNDTIVYESNRPFTGTGCPPQFLACSNSDVYAVSLSGGETRLTTATAPDMFPHVSPDGTTVAYTSYDGCGRTALWVVPTSGGSPRQLTGCDDVHGWDLAWSPDSSKIAYAAPDYINDPQNGSADIYVADASGSLGSASRITNVVGNDVSPEWSPNGSTIVFASYRNGSSNLSAISSSGGSVTALTTGIGNDEYPAVSPNGSSIVFWSTRSCNTDVFLIPFAGEAVPAGRPAQCAASSIGSGGYTSNSVTSVIPLSTSVSGGESGTAPFGVYTVSESFSPTQTPPAGGTLLAAEAVVSTPGTMTATSPFTLFFTLDTSLAPGVAFAEIGAMRNGVRVPSCSDQYGSAASPDPCLGSSSSYGNSIYLRLRASDAAGRWDFFSAPPKASFVTRDGTKLLLNGHAFRPVGLNIYNANSSGNCWYDMAHGSTLDDALTAIGQGKNAMRAWFFQSLATNSGQRDWSAFDHTLAVARAHGVKVIVTLANQWADCEPAAGYKTDDWYTNGYKQVDAGGIVSYRDWVQEVAARYKDDPTILTWQLVNEPEVKPSINAVCSTNAAGILESFAADVSAVIKSVDPNHLISLGTIGSGQCGAQGGDYKTVMSVPNLDLCEYHDYTYNQLIPGDQWNGLQVRINQCNELGKPLLGGELGVKPSDVGGSLRDRANVVAGKLCAQLTAGVAGELLWAWDKNGSLLDNYDIGPADPVLDVLSPWSDSGHSCSAPVAPSGAVAAAGDGSAAVSWLPPGSDGGSPVTSYTVTSNPGGVTKTVGGTTTGTTLTGLTNATAYTFTVTATNAAGASAASTPSNAVTPKLGNPTPAAATGTASATTATTVSTGTDPAATGGTTSSVTVPGGTAGGVVSVTQSGTSQPAPSGYQFGGVQVEITAPSASAANPLTLVFTLTPGAGQTPDATEIYRAEGAGPPILIGDCSGTSGQAVPDPCVSNRQFVTIGGQTDIQLTVLTSSASHWNSATPKPGAVKVSDSGYSPQNLTIQPGAYVNWAFAGKKSHSVTDSVGLGSAATAWFDSGSKSSGGYSFKFPAAGTFTYRSTVNGDSMTGAVFVPVVVTPASGRTTTSFSVIWSTKPLSGYVFDIQYRFRPAGSTGWKSWTNWKSGVTTTSVTFVPSQGAGTYGFHARLRNAGTGRASAYSPDGTISVS